MTGWYRKISKVSDVRNYQKEYELLISSAHKRNLDVGYYEKHHILPRSMGGTDEASNIVHLTPKEHLIAHYLLWKIYEDIKLLRAFVLMSGQKNKTLTDEELETISDDYAKAKEEYSKHRSAIMKEMTGNNHIWGSKIRPRVATDEWRQKASERVSGIRNPMYGVLQSPERRNVHGLNLMGDKNPMYGRVHPNKNRAIHSDEHKCKLGQYTIAKYQELDVSSEMLSEINFYLSNGFSWSYVKEKFDLLEITFLRILRERLPQHLPSCTTPTVENIKYLLISNYTISQIAFILSIGVKSLLQKIRIELPEHSDILFKYRKHNKTNDSRNEDAPHNKDKAPPKPPEITQPVAIAAE